MAMVSDFRVIISVNSRNGREKADGVENYNLLLLFIVEIVISMVYLTAVVQTWDKIYDLDEVLKQMESNHQHHYLKILKVTYVDNVL